MHPTETLKDVLERINIGDNIVAFTDRWNNNGWIYTREDPGCAHRTMVYLDANLAGISGVVSNTWLDFGKRYGITKYAEPGVYAPIPRGYFEEVFKRTERTWTDDSVLICEKPFVTGKNRVSQVSFTVRLYLELYPKSDAGLGDAVSDGAIAVIENVPGYISAKPNLDALFCTNIDFKELTRNDLDWEWAVLVPSEKR